MVPNVAVPTTAPNSYAVSETADAAPAFAVGTEATMMSLEIVCDTPTPSSSTMNDATTAATDRSWRNSRMSRKPADTRMSPATIRVQGANLRASRTTYRPPIIDTIAPGNVTSPAAN